MSKTIRVAICNLQTGIGTTRGYWQYLATGWKYLLPHGSSPLKKAVEFLCSAQIDIAAFCEIGGGSMRTRAIDQVDLLSNATELRQNVFFPTLMIDGWKNQGNAICTRYPLCEVRNHALPGTGEPRFLSEAELQIFGVSVRVFVTHLSLQRKMRKPQIRDIEAIVGERETPMILAGDFNVSAEAELDLLTDSHLEKAASAPTFPSWQPTRWLDHLFFSEHFTIVDCYAFDRFLFSDHLPFIAEVELTDRL